jgi:hypothetical protein
MNIYEKIQKVKLELSKRELKKSGENTFAKYKYYELGDFMPSIIELCEKHKLFTQISFTNEEGILLIIDGDEENARTLENGMKDYDCVRYSSPTRELDLKGANAIQTLGGIQTYLRRYLYMNAFDIVEADMFDGVEFERKKKAKKEKTELDLIIEKAKEAFKDANDETKSKVGTKMKSLGYNTFSDLSKKQSKNDIIELANVLNIEVPEDLLDKETTIKGNK